MAVTRINNNQISDAASGNIYLGINAAAKLQNYSITSQKISNNLTYGSDLTVAGNLVVQGNVTAIDTVDLVVEDPVIVLAKDQAGTPSLDIGYIGVRGDEENIAFVWNEANAEFATIFTSSEVTNTTVTIDSYASLRVNDITAANATISGDLTFDGNILGNISLTGDLIAENITANANISAADATISGNVTSNNATITSNLDVSTITSDSIDTTGNIVANNLNSNAAVTGVDFTASETVSANNITVTNNIDTATIDASGNVTVDNLNANLTVAATDVVASETVSANNITVTNNIDTATIDASGNVTVDNLNANLTVTATDVAATETVSANNITVTNNIDTATIDASGNIVADNLNANTNITTVTLDASGNIIGANLNSNLNVTGVTFTASGNVDAANISTSGNITAVGDITGDNLIAEGAIIGNVQITGNLDLDILNANTINVTGVTTSDTFVADTHVDTPLVTNDSGNLNITTTTSGNIVLDPADNVILPDENPTSVLFVDAAGAIDTSADLTYSGNVLTVNGNVAAGNLAVVDAIAATSVSTSADIVAAGNISAQYVISNNLINTGGPITITAPSGDVVFDISGNIDLNNRWINDLADPVAAKDAATKQYVDDAVSTGITIHEPVQLLACGNCIGGTYTQGGTLVTVTDTIANNTVVFSTAANLQPNDQLWFSNSFNGIVANKAYFVVSAPNTSAAVLSTAYNGQPVTDITSGSSLTESARVNSGQGATLTNNGANVVLVIDGVTTEVGFRVLLETQANAVQNGVYVVTTVGDGSTAWVLTRSSDMDTYIPDNINGLDSGDYFYVEQGDDHAGESHVMTAPVGPVVIGFDNLTFTQFSASQVYTADTQAGLTLNGTVFSAKVDNDTTAFDPQGNIIVKAGANLVTPNIGSATGASLTLTGNISADNASVTGNVNGNNGNFISGLYSATVDASGNITGGNIATGGQITATGNIDAANINATTNVTATTVIASGNIEANNATITNTIDAGGNITGANLNANASVTAVTISASGNLEGNNAVITNNIDTATVVATGNIDAANINATTNVTATTVIASGNIEANNATITNDATVGETLTANNITVTNSLDVVSIDVSGNVVAGNLNSNAAVTGVDFIASETVSANNATITNNLDVATIDASGNVDVANLNANTNITTSILTATGNITGGNIDTAGLISAAAVAVSGNVDANNVTVTNDIDSNNITVTGTVTTPNVTSTVGLTVTTGSDGNIVLDPNGVGVIILEDETANRMLYTGANKEIATDANATFDGANLVITGSLSVDNITIDGADITSNTGELTVNSAGADINFRVAGDAVANLLVTDAGTDTVLINTGSAIANATLQVGGTRSLMVPVGTTGERPNPAATGMVRFNTSTNSLEFYDQEAWTSAGSDFTIITYDDFSGDGACTTFTLSEETTTAGAIVSINGIVQIPITAYSITDNQLVFTEAPSVSDLIDVRILTTTSAIGAISNTSGNAVVEVTDSSSDVLITGDLIPTVDETQDLGSTTQRWKDLYLSGNSIILGNLVIKNTSGNVIGFFGPDGTTPGTIDTDNIDSAAIRNGTSNVSVIASGGNVDVNIGDSPVVTFWSGGIDNRQANGVGNIGTSTSAFNTIFAKATSAQYADLAEMYEADNDIAPGTVVCFGGDREITVCNTDMCTRIAGVISTNPSYLMNSTIEGEHVAAVALTGRVPVRVIGLVRKGDMMVSAGNGAARAESNPVIGSVIGKALENFDGTEGVIEVVVGRL